MIILDTDVCIEILRGNQKVIQKRMFESDDIGISFMTIGELYYGAYMSGFQAKNLKLISTFLESVSLFHTDIMILKKFGELKKTLSDKKILLPDADIFIAATTLIHGKKLITGNTKHFERFDKLVIENWIRND